jgi:hypothetical protein
VPRSAPGLTRCRLHAAAKRISDGREPPIHRDQAHRGSPHWMGQWSVPGTSRSPESRSRNAELAWAPRLLVPGRHVELSPREHARTARSLRAGRGPTARRRRASASARSARARGEGRCRGGAEQPVLALRRRRAALHGARPPRPRRRARQRARGRRGRCRAHRGQAHRRGRGPPGRRAPRASRRALRSDRLRRGRPVRRRALRAHDQEPRRQRAGERPLARRGQGGALGGRRARPRRAARRRRGGRPAPVPVGRARRGRESRPVSGHEPRGRARGQGPTCAPGSGRSTASAASSSRAASPTAIRGARATSAAAW